MTTIKDKVLEKLKAWQFLKMPRNQYVYTYEGEIYIRWTPAIKNHKACFTLANVTIEEKLRGQGIFKAILQACCETSIPTICLELIHNPRLAKFATAKQYRNRETKVILGEGAPTVKWMQL